MRLVYTETNNVEVRIGDVIKLDDDKMATIVAITKPHKPSSTGRVRLRYDATGMELEFYPSVIDATWIEREDQH